MSYVAPTTVDQALEILTDSPDSRVFAGATDILPQAKAGRPLPGLLVDLKRIPRLMRLDGGHDGEPWTIGAATPAARIFGHSGLRSELPGLAEGAGLIGSDQVQNRASLGGNLCNASPAADTGPAMAANRARATIAGPHGERDIPVTDLMAGPGRTSLEPGEIVVEFSIDRPGPRTGDAYLRFTPRTEMDIAVVGAAARVTLTEGGEIAEVSVVLGAVAPTIVAVDGIDTILVGHRLGDALLAEAADAARRVCNPIDDKRGTKEYRTRIAGVLTQRALRIAAQRAEGQP